MKTIYNTKLNFSSFLAVIAMTIVCGCGGKVAPDTSLPPPKEYTFGLPTNFGATPLDTGAVVSFDRNPAAASYKIYFGDTADLNGFAGSDVSPISVTANVLSLTGLTNGETYYFAATAVKSDGTESAKTAVISVVPAEPPPGQVQKTVDVSLSICFNEFNEFQLIDGQMIFTDHTDGAKFPGQDHGCDIEGVQMHITSADGDDITIPAASPWGPQAVDALIDLPLPGYVEGSTIVISAFDPIQDKCSALSSKNFIYIQAAPDEAGVLNKIQFNGNDCGANNALDYSGDDAIHFQLIYTAME